MAKTRCALLMDNENINHAFSALKRSRGAPFDQRLDYNQLINAIVPMGCELIGKTVYMGTLDSAANGWQGFKTFLEKNGFRVVWKTVKEIRTGNGGTIKKANFDVEIATDACRYAWRRDCTEIILLSGDSDFAYLIDQLHELGIKVAIVSSNASLSSELRERADRLILLDDFNIQELLLPITV